MLLNMFINEYVITAVYQTDILLKVRSLIYQQEREYLMK